MRGRTGIARRRPAAGEGGVTLYDVLGVPAGASADTLRRACGERARQLRPGLEAGAPSPVVAAAVRAREAVELASLVLGDPERRRRYDQGTGLQRGRGLRASHGFAEGGPHDDDLYGPLLAGTELLPDVAAASFGALLAWMAPRPAPPRRRAAVLPGRRGPKARAGSTVPDVRGLFFRSCQAAATMAGFRLSVVRLTADPAPVEGLVTGQAPAPGTVIGRRRPPVLTVEVWHPPRGR